MLGKHLSASQVLRILTVRPANFDFYIVDEFEANTHFCNGSAAAKDVISREQFRLSAPA